MEYKIEVSDGTRILEKIIFTYRDEAIYFAEKRRKQGYTVTLVSILISKGE